MFLRSILTINNDDEIKKLHHQVIRQISTIPASTALDPHDPHLDNTKQFLTDACRIAVEKLRRKNKKALDYQDENGFTLLHWAASKGSIFLVNLLLNYKVHRSIKNNDNETPLHLAITMGYTDIVYMLCNNYGGDNDFNQMSNLDHFLFYAMSKGASWEMIEEINRHFPQGKSSLELNAFFLKNRYLQAAYAFESQISRSTNDELIAETRIKITTLIRLAESLKSPINHIQLKAALRSEFSEQAFPNIIDRFIIEQGNLALNKKLIDQNSEVINHRPNSDNNENLFNFSHPCYAVSPLMMIKDIKRLNRKLADNIAVEIIYKHVTPLAWAVKCRNIPAINQLIQAGADIHELVDIDIFQVPDSQNTTASESLILNLLKDKNEHRKEEIIDLLIAYGAQLNTKEIMKVCANQQTNLAKRIMAINGIEDLSNDSTSRLKELPRDIITYHLLPFFTNANPINSNRIANQSQKTDITKATMRPRGN